MWGRRFSLRSSYLLSALLRAAVLHSLFQLAGKTKISDNEKGYEDMTARVAKMTEMASFPTVQASTKPGFKDADINQVAGWDKGQ